VDSAAWPQRIGQQWPPGHAGLIQQPLEWLLFSEFSVVLALVHLFTFFMVVPIFNSMIRIDKRLIEAAYDAGATGWQTLVNIIIPLAKAGDRDRLDFRDHDRHG
jgi:ABC-type spermidine/putrescine transport system permease subunit I